MDNRYRLAACAYKPSSLEAILRASRYNSYHIFIGQPSTGVPASFSVEKSGILNANSIFVRCYYANVKTGPPIQLTVSDDTTNKRKLSDNLDSSEPINFSCPALYGPPRATLQAIEGDVVVLVSFVPQYHKRERAACARFVLRKDATGQLNWFSQPVGDCQQMEACLDRNDAAHRAIVMAFRRRAPDEELDSLRHSLESLPPCSSLLPSLPK